MTAQPLFRRGPACAVLLLVALLSACASGRPRTSARPPVDSISTGYGREARGEVTGSVSSIKADTLHDRSATQLEQLITGRASGVEVLRMGGKISLRIRGAASFMATSEPLYVIDGVQIVSATFSDAMSGINPADVLRIDVLKDAAATAIYGTSGANGVVVVTTRRGGH